MRRVVPLLAAPVLTGLLLAPLPAAAAPVVLADEPACPEGRPNRADPTPNATSTGRLAELLGLARAHAISTGRGVGVAVLDTGVGGGGQIDVVSGGGVGKPGIYDPHGTMVAGLVAGENRDGEPLGVAPGARIVSIKVGDARDALIGDASDDENLVDIKASAVARGIDLAVDRRRSDNVRVINLSLGLEAPSPDVERAISRATDAGILVVAAVGNRGVDAKHRPSPPWRPDEDAVQYPARYADALAVTGLGADDTLDPSLVLTGQGVDVSAPAPGLVTVPAGGGSCVIGTSGSSWATGVVSGVAALVFAEFPESTPEQVATRIMATAQGALNADDLDGHGMVQPYEALTAPLHIKRNGELVRARAVPDPVTEGAPPPLPGAPDTRPQRTLLWWGLGAGGVLLAALLLRPLTARRRG